MSENPFQPLYDRLDAIESILLEIKHRPVQNSERSGITTNQPIRLKAAAAYLGLAETSLYSLIHQGKIKPLKPGKHVLFTKEMLDAYLKGERPSATEKTDASTYLLKNKKSAL